jgi:hypothetical protein
MNFRSTAMAAETVTPIRPLTDEFALAWIAGQEDGQTNLRPAELARRFGWSRQRTGRRLDAWEKTGQIRRRGRVIIVVSGSTAIADKGSLPARTNRADSVDVKPNSVSAQADSSIRFAAPVPASMSAMYAPSVRAGETPADNPDGSPVVFLAPPGRPVAVPAGARRGRTSWPLVALAYGFFALGIGVNMWNASSGGALVDVALPAAMGVLAEGVVFFLPAWAMTLPWRRRMLAWVLFLFISAFALTNSLRMASIVAADQTTARADRQTEGVRTADRALDAARAERDKACGPGKGKSVSCRIRQEEVAKMETARKEVGGKVVAQAKPEAGDFAKLVAWVSKGAVQPGANDFEMLWLLFRTFLPQVGGLVLMLARGSR